MASPEEVERNEFSMFQIGFWQCLWEIHQQKSFEARKRGKSEEATTEDSLATDAARKAKIARRQYQK